MFVVVVAQHHTKYTQEEWGWCSIRNVPVYDTLYTLIQRRPGLYCVWNWILNHPLTWNTEKKSQLLLHSFL